jgi:hypothetical protein
LIARRPIVLKRPARTYRHRPGSDELAGALNAPPANPNNVVLHLELNRALSFIVPDLKDKCHGTHHAAEIVPCDLRLNS